MGHHGVPLVRLEAGPVISVADPAHQLVHHLEVRVHVMEHAEGIGHLHLRHSHVRHAVIDHRRHPREHIRHSHVDWRHFLENLLLLFSRLTTEPELFVEGLILVGVFGVKRAE